MHGPIRGDLASPLRRPCLLRVSCLRCRRSFEGSTDVKIVTPGRTGHASRKKPPRSGSASFQSLFPGLWILLRCCPARPRRATSLCPKRSFNKQSTGDCLLQQTKGAPHERRSYRCSGSWVMPRQVIRECPLNSCDQVERGSPSRGEQRRHRPGNALYRRRARRGWRHRREWNARPRSDDALERRTARE
jgi:hypothetical protein